MDPRSPATPEILGKQLQLGRQIFGETIEARRALAEINSVQKQISDAQAKLVGQERHADLRAALAESQSEIGKILASQDHSANAAPGLQEAYNGLASSLRVVESGDRETPSQALAVYKESSRQVQARVEEWSDFKRARLPKLNERLRTAGAAPIAISEIERLVEFLISR